VWAVGSNDFGQLGDGTTTERTSPVQVSGLSGATALADDGSANLSVSVQVYNAQQTLVRTLLNAASQAVGTQSVVWDGKNDSGVVLPAGSYTVTVTASDSTGLAAERSTMVSLASRLATTTYAYDRLSRLTGVAAPSGSTTYAYDPVGNRITRARGGTPTSSSYDRADRITGAGAVSYSVDANGNLVVRGADTFGYDQANA
jgi:YD repeat-containing protein